MNESKKPLMSICSKLLLVVFCFLFGLQKQVASGPYFPVCISKQAARENRLIYVLNSVHTHTQNPLEKEVRDH